MSGTTPRFTGVSFLGRQKLRMHAGTGTLGWISTSLRLSQMQKKATGSAMFGKCFETE